MFARLKSMVAPPGVAVDLGTANTRIYSTGDRAIIERASVISRSTSDCCGAEADQQPGFLGNKALAMPLCGGVIVDPINAANLLRPLLRQSNKGFRRPVSLACAPTDSSARERNLLAKAIINAGALHVSIIPEVWAAALGADLDTTLPRAQVLVDIGEGVTDMAVIRDGRIIYAAAVRTACSDLQKAIRSRVMAKYRVYLLPADTERLTHELASLSWPDGRSRRTISVDGLDLLNKCKVKTEIDNADVIDAMMPVVEKLLRMIKRGLNSFSGGEGCEIMESGICLTGGGALIRGIDKLIAVRTDLAVRIAPDPIHSVIRGAANILNYWHGYEHWWENISWPEFRHGSH